MGAWGTGLYQDDVAYDVKSSFVEKIRNKKTSEVATAEILAKFDDLINDEDDSVIFWLALADTQHDLGRLQPEVKEKALELLEKGGDIERWIEDNNKEGAKKREVVLNKLFKKLNSPQPPPKKLRRPPKIKCPWQIGDVLACKLDDDEAKKNGLYGRYILLQKVDECNEYEPIFLGKMTETDKLIDIANFHNLENIIVSIHPTFNTLGYLFESSPITKKFAENLIYLGNAEIILPPRQPRSLAYTEDGKPYWTAPTGAGYYDISMHSEYMARHIMWGYYRNNLKQERLNV